MGTPSADRVTQSLQALTTKGERITVARRAVIEVLDNTTDHLTADEIAIKAGATAPGVHRTTVYRALTTLGELGVVSHTHVAGSATIYHLTTPGRDHPATDHAHVQCTSCNRIIDIDESALRPLERTLRKDIGFRLDVHHAAFLGTCADCVASTPE